MGERRRINMLELNEMILSSLILVKTITGAENDSCLPTLVIGDIQKGLPGGARQPKYICEIERFPK